MIVVESPLDIRYLLGLGSPERTTWTHLHRQVNERRFSRWDDDYAIKNDGGGWMFTLAGLRRAKRAARGMLDVDPSKIYSSSAFKQ